MSDNPHAHRIAELAEEARRAAANIEHEWDHRSLDWPLNQDSVVVEVGGYKGRWALQIAERYQPRLYVFEPQPWAAEVCRAVLGGQAMVEGYGLGVEDGHLPMGHYETDGCSFVDEGGTLAACQMKSINAAFRALDITRIDLMMINIEGYEYTLISHMLDRGILPDRLMVQFHTFADPDGNQQQSVHEQLAALGYTVPWSYGAQLTAWERTATRKRGRKRT